MREPTDSSMRVGVIGRGFGARVVAPVFAETDGCDVVEVVSPRDESAVRALCARSDVHLIAVHSPPFLHVDHVAAAIAGGKAVLCDKPFGSNAAEATEMLALAEAAGVAHFLNFEFRCHPARQALRNLVRDGAIGAIEHVHWSAFNGGSRVPLRRYGWLFDAARGGGWIGAWGSHVLDFLRWTFGEVVGARADLRTTIAERPDADGALHRCTAEDGFTATLTLESGAAVTIDTTFAAPVTIPQRVTVIGTDGVLEAVADRRVSLRTDAGVREEFEIDPTTDDPHLLPMRRWAAAVRDAITSGEVGPDVPTFADGLACARLMDTLRGR